MAEDDTLRTVIGIRLASIDEHAKAGDFGSASVNDESDAALCVRQK